MYCVYSIGGYFLMKSYVEKCVENECTPFKGSLVKSIFMMFLMGGITASMFLYSLIYVIITKIFPEDSE